MRSITQCPLTSALKDKIYEKFSQHAINETGMDGLEQDPVVFEMRTTDACLGSVVVQLFWGQLHIKYLVVDEGHRGQGIGTALMTRAFEYGRDQGCRFAFVETMSFQAPAFYQKLGFTKEFKRGGFAKGSSIFYMRREL